MKIYLTDYKEYDINGIKIAVGNINAYDEETALDFVERMREVMPLVQAETGMDMCFALVSILHDDLSATWLVPMDETADAVLEAAFGDEAVYDGIAYMIEPYASRKAVFIPAITDVLESYPKE